MAFTPLRRHVASVPASPLQWESARRERCDAQSAAVSALTRSTVGRRRGCYFCTQAATKGGRLKYAARVASAEIGARGGLVVNVGTL